MNQECFNFGIDAESAKTIVKILEENGGWMRTPELAAKANMAGRTVRRLIVCVLRPAGSPIVSGEFGYKINPTPEEAIACTQWMGRRAYTGIVNFATFMGWTIPHAMRYLQNVEMAKIYTRIPGQGESQS